MKKYTLSKELYRQTIWFIKQYEQKKVEYKSVAWSAPVLDGQPRGTDVGRPTEQRAERAARLSTDLQAIDWALEQLPEYYRAPVLDNVLHRAKWPSYAGTNTYKRYKRKFVYLVAKRMGWI